MHIDRLVDRGILRESTGPERHRIYLADKILAILEGTQNDLDRERK